VLFSQIPVKEKTGNIRKWCKIIPERRRGYCEMRDTSRILEYASAALIGEVSLYYIIALQHI